MSYLRICWPLIRYNQPTNSEISECMSVLSKTWRFITHTIASSSYYHNYHHLRRLRVLNTRCVVWYSHSILFVLVSFYPITVHDWIMAMMSWPSCQQRRLWHCCRGRYISCSSCLWPEVAGLHLRIIRNLHWLPIKQRIAFKLSPLAPHCQWQSWSPYLAFTSPPGPLHKGRFRSSSFNIRRSASHYDLVLQLYHLKVGDLSFHADNPRAYHSLPTQHVELITDTSLSANSRQK